MPPPPVKALRRFGAGVPWMADCYKLDVKLTEQFITSTTELSDLVLLRYMHATMSSTKSPMPENEVRLLPSPEWH